MCIPTAVTTGVGLLGSIYNTVSGYNVQTAAADQAYENAKYSNAINQRNADLAELNARDALARGQNEQEQSRRETLARVGSMTAQYGAGNITLDSGTPFDVLADYSELGELEALTIEAEANRQAQNYLISAHDARNQGIIDLQEAKYLEEKADIDATGSLIGGIKNVGTQFNSLAENIRNPKIKGPNYF